MNFSLFPIPLLSPPLSQREGEETIGFLSFSSPPPSQREGGGNYRFPIFLLTSPFPKGKGRKLLYFLPLLWRGRCRRGRYLDFYPIPLLNPPPSQGGMFCFFFLPKGKGKLKETLPRLSFHEVKILAGGEPLHFLSILASYPLWFGVDKNGAVAIILFLLNQKERENYLFGNKECFSLFHRESF